MGEEKKEEIERNVHLQVDKKSKGVCFAFVEIREYEMVLGDNPSVSNGPPISLGWGVESIAIFTVDMYERSKDPRARHVLQVPATLRMDWLLNSGYTARVIHQVSQEATMIRLQRHESITKSQLREKADDFAADIKRAADWIKRRRENTVKCMPLEAKCPLIRYQSADGISSTNHPRRKGLENRSSVAFL